MQRFHNLLTVTIRNKSKKLHKMVKSFLHQVIFKGNVRLWRRGKSIIIDPCDEVCINSENFHNFSVENSKNFLCIKNFFPIPTIWIILFSKTECLFILVEFLYKKEKGNVRFHHLMKEQGPKRYIRVLVCRVL